MKLSKEQLGMLAGLNFEHGSWEDIGKMFANSLKRTNLAPSDPIPEKIPLTHFEILKLDAVFMDVSDDEIRTGWSSERSIHQWRYCLTIDYIGAVTPEEVVWMKLEREA